MKNTIKSYIYILFSIISLSLSSAYAAEGEEGRESRNTSFEGTTMEGLPNEVLTEILRALPNPDRRRMRNVSKRFWSLPALDGEISIFAQCGNSEKVEECLQRLTIDPDDLISSDYLKSALMLAVKNGHKEVVDLLLEKDPRLVQDADNRGWPILHLVAEMGSLDLLKHLIEKYPNSVMETVDSLDQDSYMNANLLEIAAQKEHLEMIKFLIEEYPNLIKGSIRDGEDSLIEDLYQNDKTTVVEYLLDLYLPLISTDYVDIDDVIKFALALGRLDALQYIYDYDARLIEEYDDGGALNVALEAGFIDSVKFLLEKYPSLIRRDHYRGTALELALDLVLSYEDREIFEFLLQSTYNEKDCGLGLIEPALRSLMHRYNNDNEEVVEMLRIILDQLLFVFSTDSNDFLDLIKPIAYWEFNNNEAQIAEVILENYPATPDSLHPKISNLMAEFVSYGVRREPSPEAKRRRVQGPEQTVETQTEEKKQEETESVDLNHELGVAIMNNNLDQVRTLIDRGANPLAEGPSGRTALQLADFFGNQEIIDLLSHQETKEETVESDTDEEVMLYIVEDDDDVAMSDDLSGSSMVEILASYLNGIEDAATRMAITGAFWELNNRLKAHRRL